MEAEPIHIGFRKRCKRGGTLVVNDERYGMRGETSCRCVSYRLRCQIKETRDRRDIMNLGKGLCSIKRGLKDRSIAFERIIETRMLGPGEIESNKLEET